MKRIILILILLKVLSGISAQSFSTLRDSFIRYEYSDTIKASEFLNDLYQIAKTSNTKEDLTEYYLLNGWYLQDRSDFYGALQSFKKSASLARKYGYLQREADAYGNMANVYDDLSDDVKRMEYHQRSLQICEKILRTSKDSLAIRRALMGKSAAYGNLSYLYKEVGKRDKAIQMLNEGIHIDSILKNYDFIAISLNLYGNLYKEEKKYDSALYFIHKAMWVRKNYLKKSDDYVDEGLYQGYHNIGNVFKELGNLDSAEFYYKLSQEMSEISGDKFHAIYLKSSLGDLEYLRKKYDTALLYYFSAYKDAQGINSYEKMEFITKQISNIYASKENYQLAYEYLLKSMIFKDSTFNAEKLLDIGKAEVSYQFKFKSSMDSLNYATQLEEKEKFRLADNKRFEAEAARKNVILYSVISILLLVVFFTFYLIKLYQDKKKANDIIAKQQRVTESHLQIIEEKQKEIVDSINYAKRIQVALLANEELMKKHLPNHFVFFQPKDIVSGDFYWFSLNNDSKGNQVGYLAVCDSTGHGVPGAFMSLLNISFLNEAINEKLISEPHLILNHARQRLTENLSAYEQKDGFDGVLMKFNFTTQEITYAAANTSPIFYDGEKFENLPYDHMPVGISDQLESFNLYSVPKISNSTLYLTTDGFLDQFGGEKGKKLKQKGMLKMLESFKDFSLEDKKIKVKESFNNWKGDLEQLDDVCMIGIKIDYD